MKKKQKKESNLLKNLIITLTIIIIIVLIFFYYLETGKTEEEKIMNSEGYTTTIDDAFYKKIVTNNTLDEYYDDLANNKDSEYEEYYFSKESKNFIELKLEYKNSLSTTLNLTADLRTDYIEFNYELSKDSSHLIIEGNSSNDYSCKIIVKKSVSDQTASSACDYIMEELEIFNKRKADLLKNEKVKEIINQPIKQYKDSN